MDEVIKSKKVIANASWIITGRLVQAILSFCISILTARYLGPSNFGIINYAASVVAFALPLMKLGLDSILVQEYINHPEEDNKTMGTSLVLNMVSSVLCIIGAVVFCLIANPGEKETLIVCALYSLMLPAQAMEMVIYWYQSKLMSKYTSIVSLCAYVLTSAYKVVLLVYGKSVYWFAVSNAIDSFLIASMLHALYRKRHVGRLVFSADKAKQMLSRSKYYILSGMMVTIFAQTDRIMLKAMIDETAVGYYSAATACAGITSFVFSAIIESMRPVILEGKKQSNEIYENRVKQLYATVVCLALIQSLVVTVFAEVIVRVIYGAQYEAAVSGLRVVVWFTTFSYFGGAKDIWILAEGKQRYLIWLNMAGAAANIVLNFALIPIWGITGAAIASLITQFWTNIVMGFVIKPLRQNNMLLLQSLRPKYLKEQLAAVIRLTKRNLMKKYN